MQNINRVVLTGNLTRDPELKSTTGGTAVCQMRLACNGRRKNGSTGQWEDQPNYFDVVCFGAQAENVVKFLAKGRPVAVDGRLQWREWQTQQGEKRQSVEIVADSVQFLSDGHRDGDQGHSPAVGGTADSTVPVSDEDIPFHHDEFPLDVTQFRGYASR